MTEAVKIGARMLAVQIQKDIEILSNDVVSLDSFEDMIQKDNEEGVFAELLKLSRYHAELAAQNLKK